MEFKQVTFTYAGIELDTFSDSDGNCYITTGSIVKGLGRNARNVRDFFKAYPEHSFGKVLVTVTTGQGAKRKFPAYSVEIISEMYTYWAMLGHKNSIALLAASAKENLLNRVEEAHGLGKAVEVREERLRVDFEKVKALIMSQPINPKTFIPKYISKSDVDNQDEFWYGVRLSYFREKCEKIKQPKFYDKSQRKMFYQQMAEVSNQGELEAKAYEDIQEIYAELF